MAQKSLATESAAGSRKIKVACLQFAAGADPEANFRTLAKLAESTKADLLTTPENSDMMGIEGERRKAFAHGDGFKKALSRFCQLAKRLKVWLLVGSMSSPLAGGKIANRSWLISPEGAQTAFYDKLHLFDFKAAGEQHSESAVFTAGERAVAAVTPGAKLGMTICYDLRFPELYRLLAREGCEIFTVPSAFTRTTGRAHWRTLLRARAIENGAFVVAPAQCGEHPGSRRTWGHSMIVGPWGEVLAEAAAAPRVISATLDMERVKNARSLLPAWKTQRSFTPLIR